MPLEAPMTRATGLVDPVSGWWSFIVSLRSDVPSLCFVVSSGALLRAVDARNEGAHPCDRRLGLRMVDSHNVHKVV